MAPDGERPMSSSSPTRTTPIYSLATTKAVKPANKTVVTKPSIQITLLQQQRQRQQQQLRAIRRKRTVAFAVNHERVSQPTAACVVSADAAPDSGNSSSVQSESTRVTENSKNCTQNFLHSTLNHDPTRASPTIRDCSCTFQQKASSGFGEDHHVQEDTNKKEQSNAETGSQNLLIEDKHELHSTNDTQAEKTPKRNNRLVVDIRCAEEAAAAAAIANDTAQVTSSCDESHSAPVPVTPTFLSPSAKDLTQSKIGWARRPSKKQRLCPDESTLTSLPSCLPAELAAKTSMKPKMKRVRYDMECVPPVDINEEVWRDFSSRFRNQSQSTNLSLPLQCQFNDNIIHSGLLKGSVLWIPSSREEWEDCVSEMKAVCTSAAFRRWSKNIIKEYENSISKINTSNSQTKNSTRHASKSLTSFQQPLAQAFIKDRVRIDDPLRGYQIRHAEGGWLQGFLVWTNFTVWTLDFRWDSNHPECGLLHEEGNLAQDDGTYSNELQALPRGEPDPLDGGIVLKQVAEISLLGGLGCGELLLRKAIEDIRNSKNSENCKYKYVVLQATKGSMRFYEKMGFVRVGAVCRYRWARYCTKKSSTGAKKPDTSKAQSMDVDPRFHGYRHWTYTNESSKSLNAHGGPSVMMCLKLDDYGKQQDDGRSLSELLHPQLVNQKPTIQPVGNVANPDNENVAPTRKSQRRGSSCGSVTGEEQDSFGRESELGGITSTGRRSSSRSNRGKNTSLGNSGYVLYGIKGVLNSSKNNVENEGNSSITKTKRKRRNQKIEEKKSEQEKQSLKEHIDQAVVVPLAPNNPNSTKAIEKKSSITFQARKEAVPAIISSAKANQEKITHEVLPLSCGKEFQQGGRTKVCDQKNVENPTLSISPHVDHKSSPKCTNGRPLASDQFPEYTARTTPEPETVVDVTNRKESAQNGAKIEKQRAPVNDSVHLPKPTRRKRSRQPVNKVIASKLFKQKVGGKTPSNSNLYNQVVVRRNVQNRIEHDCDGRSTKRRRANDDSQKASFRWRYNGGLMIDHRYEFCYYFVLNYNDAKKKMTIVPMIKDGVFEKATDDKDKKNVLFDDKLLGRPRYQCNILETDKNWIRDAPLEDYVVVPEAMAVFDTPMVAKEAWDIGGNAFAFGPPV